MPACQLAGMPVPALDCLTSGRNSPAAHAHTKSGGIASRQIACRGALFSTRPPFMSGCQRCLMTIRPSFGMLTRDGAWG